MRNTVVFVAVAILSTSSLVFAGNGIERTTLSGIDFTLGKELSDDLKSKAASALEASCGDVLASADNVILFNVDAREARVDQGIVDVNYVLSFRVLRDSLSPRMIRVNATEFDVNTSSPEARIDSVDGMGCQ